MQQWRHQNNVWNLFKVINKDTRMTSWRRSDVFIVNFEQISHIVMVFPLLILNTQMRAEKILYKKK